MTTVPGRGPQGEATTVTVLARGDQVLVRVGTAPAVWLAAEHAGDLLRALRVEFDQAASAMLDTLRPPQGAGRAAELASTGKGKRRAMSNEAGAYSPQASVGAGDTDPGPAESHRAGLATGRPGRKEEGR